MKLEDIAAIDKKSLPQMGTKWFKVEFSSEEPNVHNKIYAFESYVLDRATFNNDLHFIEYFSQAEFGKVSYERLLKTNSKLYLNELSQSYKLTEIEKPKNVIDRTETPLLKETLKSILTNNNLAKVIPEHHPEYGEFIAEVLEYNDVRAVFKNSSYANNFPKNRNSFSLVYRNIFDIKEIKKP